MKVSQRAGAGVLSAFLPQNDCSGVNSFFHSASVLITFLIPLDLVRGSCEAPVVNVPAQLGSRDNSATPPNAIEDEIKNRLFIAFAPAIISIFTSSSQIT